MKHLRSIYESFNSDTYLDYLQIHIEDYQTRFIDSEKNFLYIVASLDSDERAKIKEYLDKSPRFRDVVVMSYLGEPSSIPLYGSDDTVILVVDKDFYNRNLQYLYKNIKFEPHPISIDLKALLDKFDDFSKIFKSYKNAKISKNLPDGFSIVKNMSLPNIIEFLPNQFEEPLTFNSKDPVDMIYLQYSIFKYMCV
jgi:hypothetical protein